MGPLDLHETKGLVMLTHFVVTNSGLAQFSVPVRMKVMNRAAKQLGDLPSFVVSMFLILCLGSCQNIGSQKIS